MRKTCLLMVIAVIMAIVVSCAPPPVVNGAENTGATIQSESTGVSEESAGAQTAGSETAEKTAAPGENIPLKERIENGDFSDVKGFYDSDVFKDGLTNEDDLGWVEADYKDPRNDWEWVERDINGDGINELILREQAYYKRFVAVLTFANGEAKLVYLWNGSAHFYEFWGDPGYYVNFDFWYGPTGINTFKFYTLDKDFNKKFVYGMNVIGLDAGDFSEEENKDWLDENPYIKENGPGMYYQEFSLDAKGNQENVKFISEDQFLSKFTEMSGLPFDHTSFGGLTEAQTNHGS